MVRNDNIVDETLSHFRICLGFNVMTSCTLFRYEMLSLVRINIVTWGVMHRVVRCFMSHNIASDDLVVRANLFMGCQNIMVDKTRLVNINLVVLIYMHMSGHVFCVKFLGNLNISRVVYCSRVMNWLDLNVSNLWLISVLGNTYSCARVNWLKW